MSGISYENVKNYWDRRSSLQEELTVGFNGNSSMKLQNNEYVVKTEFVKKFLEKKLKTLDYGCGIGRWSNLFDNYLGVDITKNLLDIAKENNKDKNYILLEKPILKNIDYDFEQFFTSTVLQHCDDDLVDRIINSLYEVKNNGFVIVLYENSIVKADHVNGRSPERYRTMFEKYFNIISFESDSHIVHGEEHSITKIVV